MNLTTPIFQLSGIGPSFIWKLNKLNIFTVEDLIYHFPFRYDDFSNTTNALEAKEGEKVTLRGEIWSIKNIYTRSGKVLTQAVFNDGTSPIELTWFNQSYLTKMIQTGDRLQVSGKVKGYKNKFSLVAPVWEKITDVQIPDPIKREPLHTGRLVPVYPETFGLTSKWLRTKISSFLPRVELFINDPLPEEIKQQMLPLKEALGKIHFPETEEDVMKSRERLGFDELFYIQLATQKARADWKSKPSVEKLEIRNWKLEIRNFIDSLPFKLTTAQLRVIDEIMADLQSGQPMNRLVQGEVGSGKTVVAAVIAYLAFLEGKRTLYMAPTEILAFQHHSTLTRLLGGYGVEVGIYTGSRKFSQGKEERGKRKETKLHPSPFILHPNIIVGTHALLSEKLNLDKVGLVIVDEQQRFGVEQRTILRNKAEVPHFLTMTATPIPRTVALTLYGDLDLSIIDELPRGRKPVRTHVVPNKKRADAYQFIKKKVLESGDQVYIITPFIEPSETMVSVKAAKDEFERLKKEVWPDLRLGLLHGKLKSKEKEQVLNDFKDHQLDILVSTSVVEVGVDVSNATIMIIEGAERFGLSQLHQLRGRVGRGEKDSFCFLFPTKEDSQTVSRLRNLEKTNNGLELAELDLKIRGTGEIFGTRQAGRFELKIASFSDLTLIEKTREAARQILSKDPKLANYPQLQLKLAQFGSGVMPD
jgi:ATP-dependent DNA helicase RecG